MTYIVDRRKNPANKSHGNRQRFIRRAKEHLREAVKKSIQDKNIADIASGEKVSIPAKGIKEPKLYQNPKTGQQERILPGNKEFQKGDRINKPPAGGGGRGKQGSNSGDGEDDFEFRLSREEFLDIFFEDLELPDLVKKNLKEVTTYRYSRAGFTSVGNPANLNVLQTMQKAMGRRIALRRPKGDMVDAMAKEIFDLEAKDERSAEEVERLKFLHGEMERHTRRLKAIPYIDPVDVRYNRFINIPQPTTQAVMVCVMDVSGSMGEREKDLAKRFFMLLHLFLQRRYDRIDVVFIRHTHEAKEVDEQEFFYSRETGGTVVSKSLELMRDLIRERYPLSDWNIYAAQASDGDNYPSDSAVCVELLSKIIMPMVQYYAYIEIVDETERRMHNYFNNGGDLWRAYKQIDDACPSFAMRRIGGVEEIFPVFQELFSKNSA